MLANFFAKNLVSRPLYNLFGKKELPILGRGERPEGANSCGLVLDNKLSTSFGMPSGHSQLAWTVAIYLLAKLISRTTMASGTKILIAILIVGIATYISYSRIYIDSCHTTEQVIFGSLIGGFGGFLIYYFEDMIIGLAKRFLL
jgi:membrane-associated phospholipid phosphatase